MKKPAPKPKKTKLGDKLEELAEAIADELKSPETPMDERIGGFKALTAYYAMTQKLPPPPDESKGKFGGFMDAVKKASGTPDF